MKAALILIGVLFSFPFLSNSQSADRAAWNELAQNELNSALNIRDNWNIAKNVIVFLGDGMGIPAVTAGRIYKGQTEGRNGEEGFNVWERFPNTAFIKTYCATTQVPDSASTATAIFTGVKTRFISIGVSSDVQTSDCQGTLNPDFRLDSIAKYAQDAGMAAGFVAKNVVTDASPSALFAKVPNRFWQCDRALGDALAEGCKDIADQLVTEEPGKNFNVIMGGGRFQMGANINEPGQRDCFRGDGRNLVEEWAADKAARGASTAYLTTRDELMNVDIDNTDYILGLYKDSHMDFAIERDETQPSLSEMALTAVRTLKKNEDGFFLFVEASKVDYGEHYTRPYAMVEEVKELEQAVADVLQEVDLEETLVIVTADHSHTLSISGYPSRGRDILGTVDLFKANDGMPYFTLNFANGRGWGDHFSVQDGQVVRNDPSTMDARDKSFKSPAAVPISYETHGGEDVGLWAVGPMSHLFHRTHEQNYISHVMQYAACVGNKLGDCARPAHATFTRDGTTNRTPVKNARKKMNLAMSSDMGSFPTMDSTLQNELDQRENELINFLGQPLTPLMRNAEELPDVLGEHQDEI